MSYTNSNNKKCNNVVEKSNENQKNLKVTEKVFYLIW